MSVPDPKPLITTVIPTYRRPKLLRRAIMSVLAQTYTHFQVCVYDNASGDETEDVVRQLAERDSRVKYYRHAENVGAVANFVFGMERVESPFFSLLSDDDFLLPEFFQKALDGFSRYPEAVFFALATIHVDHAGRVTSVPLLAWREGFYPAPQGLFGMLENDHPEWTAILFRRKVIRELGTLDPETGAPSDLDYELRIAAKWPIAVSREPGAIFVSHRESISGTTRLEFVWSAWQKMIANLDREESIPQQLRVHIREQILRLFHRSYLGLGGLAYVVNREWDQAEHAATILRDGYHRPYRALLLRFVSWAARKSRPVLYVLASLNVLRKSVRPLMNQGVAPEYRQYAALLKSDVYSAGNISRPYERQERPCLAQQVRK